MTSQLVLTIVSEDKPGIVARVTGILVKHGANLEESKMAILGGEFAAIILVTAEESKFHSLENDLNSLKADGIAVNTKRTAPISPDTYARHKRCEVSLKGADHEGIVHNLSSHLLDLNINIQSAHTQLVSAPVSGSPLFCMDAIILVPPTVSIDSLQADLDSIANRESVDIELKVDVAAKAGLTEVR